MAKDKSIESGRDNEQLIKRLDAIISLLSLQIEDKGNVADILRSVGFTFKDVSLVIGVPEGTLKSRVSRGKQKLDAELK